MLSIIWYYKINKDFKHALKKASLTIYYTPMRRMVINYTQPFPVDGTKNVEHLWFIFCHTTRKQFFDIFYSFIFCSLQFSIQTCMRRKRRCRGMYNKQQWQQVEEQLLYNATYRCRKLPFFCCAFRTFSYSELHANAI